MAQTVKDVVDGLQPGCSLPDGADRLPVDGDGEGLGAVRVAEGAAAALAGERSVESHHLVSRLVGDGHVEGPHIAAPEPLPAAGVLHGPVEDLLSRPGDGEPVLLLTASHRLEELHLLLDHQLTGGLERPKPGQDWLRLSVMRVKNSSAQMYLLSPQTWLHGDGQHFLLRSRELRRQQVVGDCGSTVSLSNTP